MKRTFKQHKAFLEYKHKHKDNILRYVELMYDKDSELNSIQNLEDRKQVAAGKAGLELEDMQSIFTEKDKAFQNLRDAFLSNQSHNKYQNLITFQQMLWNVQRDAMNNFDVLKYDKAVDVMIKLENQIDAHFKEIYVDSKIIDVAKENIKTSRSVEEKLKETKPKNDESNSK